MIKINFIQPNGDDRWLTWRKKCEAAKLETEKSVSNNASPQISSIYKDKYIKKQYYLASKSCFAGKCAYCEANITDFQRGDIEHFRPKLGVTDENDNPVIVDYGHGLTQHKGYYWLAYEIDNLLLSCEICNQPSVIKEEKIGKHNRFPVEDNVYSITENKKVMEKPLLINPLNEDPSEFIIVDPENGFMRPKNESKKGEITIKVLGLNIREQLQNERKDMINTVKSLLVSILYNPIDREVNISILKEKINGASPHVAVVRAVLESFKIYMKDIQLN